MRFLKRVAVFGLFAVLVLGGLAAWQRAELRAWWVLRQLRQADDPTPWAMRAAESGATMLEPLGEMLAEEGRASGNALAALQELCRSADDSVALDACARIVRGFPKLAPEQQQAALRFAGELRSPNLTQRLLGEAASVTDEATRQEALTLALAGNAVGAKALATSSLASKSAENRLLAVRLSLSPQVNAVAQVEPLLRDPDAAVRRAALTAVAPREDAVRDESLLASLHDDDAEVRRLTEAALRGRGLRPEHLELGRLLTHPRPETRLRVLDKLGDARDLDPGVWLRRLSHDRSPAVRAAAARFMSQVKEIDLSDRLDQMARGDPSPTVSDLAGHYLRKRAVR